MALFFRKFMGILVVIITSVGIGFLIRDWAMWHPDVAPVAYGVLGYTCCHLLHLVSEIS